MRTIYLILILILPLHALANVYKYEKVIVTQTGSDNFTFDNTATTNQAGHISINNNRLHIGDKTYKLKNLKNANCYKAKGFLFKLFYNGDQLNYVQVYKYNRVYTYFISLTN